MDRILSDFIVSLRHAGVRISVSETLDALHSVRLVGYEDRKSLRDALMAALPKSAPEKEIFNRCFNHFFSFLVRITRLSSPRPVGLWQLEKREWLSR